MAGISINLFLAEGTPDGLWVVEKSNWTGVALMAPRSRYTVLRGRGEMTRPGVYVLVGPAEGAAKSSRVYIGETDVLRDRLDAHQSKKDFWTKVVVFTAKDSNLNKAHVRYLESRLLGIAAGANRAELDNGAAPSVPALSESGRADMEAFLADMLLIYPVLGINAFENADESADPVVGERLFLRGQDALAEGRETAEGFVVFAGALAAEGNDTFAQPRHQTRRDQLVAEGVFVDDGARLRLTQDFVFGSPSGASDTLLGRSSNGREAWRTAAGVKLLEIQNAAIGRPTSGESG